MDLEENMADCTITLGAGIRCSLLGSANTACMWWTDILEGKHLFPFYIYAYI